MLTQDQKAHFDAFGFITVKEAFSVSEIHEIVDEAQRLWENDRAGAPLGEKGQHMSEFVEQSQVLTRIVNDRLRQSVELLIGSDFLWGGSEGNYTSNNAHGWHNDRPAETQSELAFTRLKINIYLDPVTKETGALRVLPGSHRPTFHLGLAPLEQIHHEKGNQDPFATPYGVPGTEIPFHSFESNPGDVVFFNQSLFHAVFHGFAGRRYIAVKFSAMPNTEEHFNQLIKTGGFNFKPHGLFSSSDNPDVKAMADRMLEAGSRIGI